MTWPDLLRADHSGDRDDLHALVARALGPRVRIEECERLEGLSNRTYRVTTDHGPVAVRLAGLGSGAFIDRGREEHNARLAAGAGIGPEVLHAEPDPGHLVWRYVEGEALTPEGLRADPSRLARVVELIGSVHDSGLGLEGRFDPGREVTRYRDLAQHTGATIPETAADLLARLADDEVGPSAVMVPAHNDAWPRNIIDTGSRLVLVDWEFSGWADPMWDLAHLSVECELSALADDRLLNLYGNGRDTDVHRFQRLKAVADLVWGLWALVQAETGNPNADWGEYAARRFAAGLGRSSVD